MKKILILLLIFITPSLKVLSSSPVSDHELDSLLNVLDQCIKERNKYTEQRKHLIQDLESKANQTVSLEARFFIYAQIFEEYKSFQMDSALIVADKRKQLAERLSGTATEYKDMFRLYSELNRAEVMMVTGMYKEALDILDSQDLSGYTRDDDRAYLFHLYHSLYMLMSQYSFSQQEKEYYRQLEYQYKDSILTTISWDNIAHHLVESSKLMMDGNYEEALTLADSIYRYNIDDYRTVGMIAHTISEIYGAQKDRLNQKKYLAISSIADIKSGVKEYMSLPELAVLIYDDGDINRSYAYMKCSLEDAIFCKARLRTLEMSRMLPIINTAYNMKMTQEKNNLKLFLAIIIALTVILVIAVLYIYKKLKELAKARQSLKDINSDLQKMNDDLNNLNKELSEANLVKEEYIGYVFSMCSSYIDKLDDFRKLVNRKIKAGQTEELHKQTSSNSYVNDELKEFYKSFDTIFLSIYPDFVEEFNSLLNDNEHIYPKEGELLTPELRIYALVRLGINDSVKIAGFLHYSAQTVYNYRLKVRNKAKLSKDNFPQQVKQIGQIQKKN